MLALVSISLCHCRAIRILGHSLCPGPHLVRTACAASRYGSGGPFICHLRRASHRMWSSMQGDRVLWHTTSTPWHNGQTRDGRLSLRLEVGGQRRRRDRNFVWLRKKEREQMEGEKSTYTLVLAQWPRHAHANHAMPVLMWQVRSKRTHTFQARMK